LLYYDENTGFTDCLGFPWFITAGSFLVSNRYMVNKTGGEMARRPTAQAMVHVRDNNGQTHDISGPAVEFGDMAGGESVTLPTTIQVDYTGEYVTEYHADPGDAIAESDESNNTSNADFSRSSDPEGAVSFVIRVPGQEELAKIKTPYVIFTNGQIEVVNTTESQITACKQLIRK